MPIITRIIRFLRIGVGISDTDVEYADSTSSTVAPTTGWQTTAPKWQNGHFIWSRTRIYYTNGLEKVSNPVCLPSGKGVASIVEQYYQSSSSSSLTGGSWISNKAPAYVEGKFVWTRSVITYTDGSSTATDAVCVTGNKGDKGDKGDNGKDGTDGKDGINGSDGIDGVDGEDGNGIASQRSLFVITDRPSGVAYANTKGWSETFVQPTQQQPYAWKCVETVYTLIGKVYSTAELVAVYQAGANPNLLENAAFTDSNNMSAWDKVSEYVVVEGKTLSNPDKGYISTTDQIEGRNSFRDSCKFTAADINFKEVLRQVVHDPKNGVSRLSPGSWYTLSFWAKGGSNIPLINQTSSDYGFAKKEIYLQAGHTYEIGVNGNIDQAAKNEGKKLEVKVYNQSQTEQKSLFITTVYMNVANMEFTPKETGIYYLESYMSDSNRPSTGKVTLNYYKVIDCGLSTYIYPSAVDTAAKIYVDGVEQTPGSDLCINWKLDTTWQRHTVSFKTKSLLSYSEAQAVLFRLLPAVSTEFERYVNICMPKLEVGMMATGFIDTRSDSKGSTGSVLRGPQLWNTCINGYRFEAGGEGDEWKDAVFYNGNTYSCIKTHVKTADNYPGSAADLNNHYWKLGQSIELLIAHIILTQYQMVENLGVRTIEMKDKDGNVVFRAKDGDLTCKGGNFENITATGNFKSRNEKTWNEIEMNADKGYLVMRGPTSVNDDNWDLPSSIAEMTDLFKVKFESDGDTLSRIATMDLFGFGGRKRVNIDPEFGLRIYSDEGTDNESHLFLSKDWIDYSDGLGHVYHSDWNSLLKKIL